VSEVDADLLRRHFVAIATSDYDDPSCGQSLPGVINEVQTLKDWLCDNQLAERRFNQAHPHLTRNPTKRQISDALEDPEPLWNHADAAVLFVTGHGVFDEGAHWVVLKRTIRARLHATAIRTSDLIGWLRGTEVEHLLVILDLCYAGATAGETVAFADFPPTWLTLASVTRNQKAATGALTTAVTEFLAELTGPTGEQFNHGPYLRVEEFIGAIQDKLGDGQRLAQLHPGLPSLQKVSPCLPNPRWRPERPTVQPARRDLALRADDLAAHWDPRSRGVATRSQGGWLFSGRTELMHRLIQATTDDPQPLLVAGAAGSGKSAVLARLVTLSDPGFCDRYAETINLIPQNLRPTPGAVDAAVLATGKVAHEVMGQIYKAVTGTGPPSTSAVPSLEELRTAWWSWLQTHHRTVTVVVDALDEAKDPHTLLTEVLAQLNPPKPAPPQVRLIVGVRSPGGTDDQAVTGEPTSRERPLADSAEHVLAAVRLRVDEAPWWQPEDLAAYAADLLTTTAESPYAEAEHREQTEQLAHTLAKKSGKSFLITRIGATSLGHRDDRVAPDDPAWLTTLADGVVGVFRDDLHTTLPDPDDRERAVHLLRAVAFAYGPGLPWRQIWPVVATAVANDPDRTYGDGDIAWLLGSRLGAYLVTDQADDITVYRLFHDALRTVLRERSHKLL